MIFYLQFFIQIFFTGTPQGRCDRPCGSVSAELTADPWHKPQSMQHPNFSSWDARGVSQLQVQLPEPSLAPAADGPSWS